MTNIIEESMIINHLTSPQKVNNPNQSPLRLIPIQPTTYKHSSGQNSKANLLEIHNNKNVDQQDSENLLNPMNSYIDITQDEAKENDLEFDLKQVLTEMNDQQTSSFKNLDEIQPENQRKQPQLFIMQNSNTVQLQIQRHKQIILQNTQFANKIKNLHELKKVNQDEKKDNQDELNLTKSLDKQMIENLKEIYQFYTKQAITTNKYNTFEKLQQLSKVMILQKFMFFCRDFKLIDLEITNNLIQKLGGKIDQFTNKKKNQFKFNHKQNFIVTKFNLVEVFKKNANTQMELSNEQFQDVITKLSNLIFPDQNELLYEYLNLNNPQEYRKKMQIIGKPFNSKEHYDILTQEKLCDRKIFLPTKSRGRAESVKKDRHHVEVQFPQVNVTQRLQKKQQHYEIVDTERNKNRINWDNLDNLQQHFDPKCFILEQDLSDKEDDYYLSEYSKQGQILKKKRQDQMNQKELQNQVPKINIYSNILNSNRKIDNKLSKSILTSDITKNLNTKSFDLQENQVKKKSVGYSPQNIEHINQEKQNQIYKAFLNQQSYREKMINRKKLILS